MSALRPALVLALAAVGLVASSGAGAQSAGDAQCVQPGEELIVQNDVVAVVGRRTGTSGRVADAFACLRATGERGSLDVCDCDSTLRAPRVRGRYVIYEEIAPEDPDDQRPYVSLTVVDPQKRRAYEPERVDCADCHPFTKYGVTRNASVAFILRIGSGRHRVAKCEPVLCLGKGDPRPTVLDSGASVDPGYLKVATERVRWRRGGRTRSAPLR